MTFRQERVFKTYKDFNGADVAKAKLANLAVHTSNLLEAYDKADIGIKECLLDTNITEFKDLRTKCQAFRDTRHKDIETILTLVHGKRSEKDAENKLEKLAPFKKASDIFKNITDEPVPADGQEVEKLTKEIADLGDKVNDLFDELNLKKESLEIEKTAGDKMKQLISDLENKLKKFEQQTVLPESKANIVSNTSTTGTLGSKVDYGTKLDSNTPKFHSKLDEDVEEWIDKVEVSLTNARKTKDTWLNEMNGYVSGTAYETIKKCRASNESWEDFKNKLLKIFKPQHKDTGKDTGNFDQFLHKFQHLSNQISVIDMSDKQRLDIFIAGLRPKTQAEMFINNVTNLDDAIARATTIENIANAPRMSEVKYVKINNSVFNKKSHVKVPFQGKCHKCQKSGHKEADCFSKRPKLPAFVSKHKPNFRSTGSTAKRTPKDLSQIECYKCHQKGHYSTKCGKAASGYSYNRPAQINVVEVNMLKIFYPEATNKELVTGLELISTCLTQKEAISMYNSLDSTYPWSLVNNWRKYDNFILSWVTFRDVDFCNDCLVINDALTRISMFPQTCLKHYKSGYGYSNILWDNSL
jgi:hypothetical protein